MRKEHGRLLFSSGDLRDFVECKFSVDLDVADLTKKIPRVVDSELDLLLQTRGNDFEEQYHTGIKSLYKSEGRSVAEIPGDASIEERAKTTIAAMSNGIDLIYQAGLFCVPWHGYPDYIRKVSGDSRFGAYRYEVADVKSRLNPSDDNVFQISLYSYLLGMVQNARPEHMYIITGDSREHQFKYANYSHYLTSILGEFSGYMDRAATEGTQDIKIPLPCSFCSYCKWKDHCSELWEDSDDAMLVAGVRNQQVRRLREHGIHSVTELSRASGQRIQGIGPAPLETISRNAALLLEKRSTGKPQFEMKQADPGRGLYRLPEPSSGDLFLDLEGDPTYPGRRLEYLFGIWDGRNDRFVHQWAHNHDEEKVAFEKAIDFISERLVDDPASYIYHYGSYEETAIKSLAAQYSTRESEVDEILRSQRLVDLLKVTRESIRTSESGYGLKDLETFFLKNGRAADIKTAQDSVVLYAGWKEDKDPTRLDTILDYNREDCISTMECRNWLHGMVAGIEPFTGEVFDPAMRTRSASTVQTLINSLTQTNLTGASEIRELAGQLTMFHRRAARPEWWEFFARAEYSVDELKESADCIGGLELIDTIAPVTNRGLPVHKYSFEEQELKFKARDRCVFAGVETDSINPLDDCGEILEIDMDTRVISIRHPGKIAQIPEKFSIAPTGPIPTYMLTRAIERYTDSLIQGSGGYEAIDGFLGKEDPMLTGHRPGSPVRDESLDRDDGILDALCRLNGSTLFIQGPPGSGKTTLGGKMIVELMKSGNKIGVASNSHRAINELLLATEKSAADMNLRFSGQKKSTAGRPESHFQNPDQDTDGGRFISNVDSVRDMDVEGNQLIAGTAWLFCNEKLDQKLDYLFIDEAGQVALGNLVAMGVSSKNIVLIGDQMQLSHPTPGIHPGESGSSTLDYMLAGQDTVSSAKGIFLNTSYRMHPSICDFISEAVYDGRLKADPDNENQKIVKGNDSDVNMPEYGIDFIEVEHSNSSQSSEAEASIVKELVDDLLTQQHRDKSGQLHPITYQDIMVVAPYNAQVNLIKAKLPPEARVGTIDLFQGQEAPVVIVSMTTSNREELPRHFEFLFSRNRLNVALSRAKCLDIVIASKDLLTIACRTIDQMEMVNTLCWARDYSLGETTGLNEPRTPGVSCTYCFEKNPIDADSCGKCLEPLDQLNLGESE